MLMAHALDPQRSRAGSCSLLCWSPVD